MVDDGLRDNLARHREFVTSETRKSLIEACIPIAIDVAERWYKDSLKREEAEAVAFLAIVHAVDDIAACTYGAEEGFVLWITSRVIRAVQRARRDDRVVRVPYSSIAEGRVKVLYRQVSANAVFESLTSVEYPLENMIVAEFIESCTATESQIIDLRLRDTTLSDIASVIGVSKRKISMMLQDLYIRLTKEN
jgi:RNA polymerase sigma factor (sigma-70 family)